MSAAGGAFPKSSRLKRSSEFLGVFKKAKRIRENGIALYMTETSRRSGSRLGVVASRRVLKHAVDRNCFKRIAREVFRLRRREFTRPYDLVVRVVDKCNITDRKHLRAVLNRLFEQAGLFVS